MPYAFDRLQRFVLLLQGRAPTAASVLVFIAAALLKPLLDAGAGAYLPPFITFYPAVVLISLISGPRLGLIAVAAALAVSTYFWISPYHGFALVDLASLYSVITFAVFGALISAIGGVARQLLEEHAAHAAERSRMARETVHRIKNLIAVIQAISMKVARHSDGMSDYNAKFSSRLAALASAQDVLIRTEWQDVSVSEIIDSALAPFRPNPALAVNPGPDIVLPARYVSGLSLALYELATNAMKYGALLARPGSVTLAWRSAGNTGTLVWTEVATGAPRNPGESTGFGTMLIQTALGHALGTRVHYEITDAGVNAEFEWPLASAGSRP
ncbi:MAG TPA: HWE histidine kinase domain-containing protein [Dongiaceae bacterium]